ncbi:MAG: hypothetical protein R3190_17145 [Thermoanaerobaculia bacterium]|nr:hypothetical protein [Thermoanaerobaculia bacterium]
MPAGLAGAFFALAAGRVAEPAEANRLQLLGLGWLYGVVVLGLIRIFPVAPWGRPLAGLLCGPVPVVLVLPADLTEDERLAGWLLGALLGLVIGALECARQQREGRSHDAR